MLICISWRSTLLERLFICFSSLYFYPLLHIHSDGSNTIVFKSLSGPQINKTVPRIIRISWLFCLFFPLKFKHFSGAKLNRSFVTVYACFPSDFSISYEYSLLVWKREDIKYGEVFPLEPSCTGNCLKRVLKLLLPWSTSDWCLNYSSFEQLLLAVLLDSLTWFPLNLVSTFVSPCPP